MAKTSEAAETSRRDFLKLATTAAPAAIAATVLGGPEAAAAATPQVPGLQDTAHTRAYYATARF